jgi:hypothetical protein
MRGLRLGLFLAIFALSACGTSLEQALRPEQPTSAITDSGSQNKKRQGLVVTDNPYMISSERLEQMNKGGFGG